MKYSSFPTEQDVAFRSPHTANVTLEGGEREGDVGCVSTVKGGRGDNRTGGRQTGEAARQMGRRGWRQGREKNGGRGPISNHLPPGIVQSCSSSIKGSCSVPLGPGQHETSLQIAKLTKDQAVAWDGCRSSLLCSENHDATTLKHLVGLWLRGFGF